MVDTLLSAHPWRHLRWLVLAPHPDDETLGAGALIAQAAAYGRLAGVVYLTDGSGSHGDDCPPACNLVSMRKREAAHAMFRLTGSRSCGPVHLGWKDAAPAAPETTAFLATTRKVAALCNRLKVDAIAVTALHEPHCDHVAAAMLAYAVHAMAKRSILVAEYVVWAAAPERRTCRVLRTETMLPGTRRHALRAHRSQLTASYGPGFRLAIAQQRMPDRDTLFLRRSR
ncbi:GlcNAc-PI de-N-acetylase [Novosphingobium barchaimii LL02]|uniref:GlcNAc-PI de-N-acetylase n=1 Tax=Novosphingobium barchaimii LL02 TaxID=1114963 RepID=A0A0J7XYG6_9SPHN|nr:PIG-L family deacetylase [Novosphingobium barchaimii]KMS56574.1 GlcNAc-PI de-N-acetylase [Novosphingobium barchaimii LL02]